MAAGQGFKTFTTGEVLTAGDVNGYLMQGINVFTNATARNAAITVPAEGQFAFTKDNNSLWYYDGAAWVASGATGDIEGVTATSPLTGGGTSGTVTVGIQNASTTQRGSVQLSDSVNTTDSTLAATSTAVKTVNDAAIPRSTVTTNGDLIYGTGAGTVTRRAIGSTGNVLTVSGGLPVWAAPATPTQSLTFLNSGNTTIPGGVTTWTISGLSNYNTIYLLMAQVSSSSASAIVRIGFNNSSGTSASVAATYVTGAATYASGNSYADYYQAATVDIARMNNSAAGQVNGGFIINGCNSTNIKYFTSIAGGTAGTGQQSVVANGTYVNSAVISSVTISVSVGNFDLGDVFVYGA